MRQYVLLGVLALAGCGGISPEPDYFALSSVAGTPSTLVTSVKIIRPTLPGYLDTPDIVKQTGVDQIKADEFKRWAEPLDKMFERVLIEDLRQRMPSSTIASEMGDVAPNPHFVIETDIATFNATDNGNALKAHVTITDKSCVAPVPSATDFAATTVSYRGEGLSALIGKMADFLVTQLAQKSSIPCDLHK
jgi:uncharacterized lipoprotein YmbA